MARKRRPAPLHYLGMDFRVEAVQPDYVTWQAVQIGMTFEEVTAILGRPMPRPHIIGEGVHVYGYLQLPLMPYPRWYSFVLNFHENRLFHKEDPFDGDLSPDGRPSKPRILGPQEGAVFTCTAHRAKPQAHHATPVDMRWQPASGRYPMEYELELGCRINPDDPFGEEVCPYKLPLPYFVFAFGGYWNEGRRFRVRGVNELGVGEWSEYRYFATTFGEG